MGRPSKLTEKQWAEIGKRLLAGETAGKLAKEFKVGRSTITDRFSGINGNIKDIANQIVAADAALKALPVSAQVSVITLVDELKAISSHLASAGKYGAMTAHRLSGIAHSQIDKIDDSNPMDSQEVLQGISALTKMSNEASTIGINLLNANKEMLRDVPESNFDLLKSIADALPD